MEGKILVVDDEVLVQFMLEDALTQAGHSVLLASSAAEAMTQLEEPVPLTGLITDIRLGRGETGWAVAMRARESRPALPIVYISGDSRADWGAYGMSDSIFMAKPFIAEDVVVALENLIKENSL